MLRNLSTCKISPVCTAVAAFLFWSILSGTSLAKTPSDAQALQSPDVKAHINSALEQTDTPEFSHGPVFPASGYDTVELGFLEKPEVRYLLAHPSEAVPAMLKRLDSRNGVRCYATPIPYFIVFKHCRDRRALPALARFLDALPNSAGGSAGVPGSPFPYAIDAIKTLAPGALPSTSNINEMFRARHQTAKKVRAAIQTQSLTGAVREP